MLYENTNKARMTAVLEALKELDNTDLLNAWNEFAREYRADDEILTWDEFDEIFGNMAASWVIDRIYYGDYKPGAELLTFNGYGNIVSIFWYELPEYVDFDELAEFYAQEDLPSWVYVPAEIADALDELDEDEDA